MALKNKKTIVFDLDGTLSNFEKIDHKIIEMIYGNSRIVMLLDKFLWSINRFEILKNTMWLLKFRLALYSIITRKNIEENFKKYHIEYFTLTYHDIKYNYENYLKRLRKKYKIRILSNNMFAKGLEYSGLRVICNTSKSKHIKIFKKYHDTEYIVGNNLLDDILVGSIKGIKTIYLGKNEFVKIFSTMDFRDIEKLTNYLLKSD